MNSIVYKNKLIEKICGKDLDYAKKLIDKFGTNINEIEESEAKQFVLLLKKIIETNDENELDTIYKQYIDKEPKEIEPLVMEKELKEYFAEQILKDLYIPEEINRMDVNDIPKELENIGVPVYDAGVNFKMVICVQDEIDKESYGTSYKDKWNKKCPFLCTSFIRNDMLATIKYAREGREAAVTFGFNNIKPEYITHMYPDDAYSETGAGTSNQKYLLPDKLINETVNSSIFSYNEIGFEKKQNGKIIEPDYLVVFKHEEKIDSYIENIRTMVSEFGNKTPIVIVDVDKCLENEAKNVYYMISDFEKIRATNQRELIVQKIKNNLITASAFRTTFLGMNMNNFDEIETKLDNILEERKELRKNMELHCKKQSGLSKEELEDKCNLFGMDFEQEFKGAFERVLEKYIVVDEDEGYFIKIPEEISESLQERAIEFELDFVDECDDNIARKMFRDNLEKMYNGKKQEDGLTIEMLEEQCKILGLCWEDEVAKIYNKEEFLISTNIEKSMGNIVKTELYQSVEKTSVELKENYKESEKIVENNNHIEY